MAHAAFRVSVPFSRKVDGKMVDFAKGALIANPALVDEIMNSSHAAHGHTTMLPDDHEAVLPHLPEDHPARAAFMQKVTEGQEPDDAAPPDAPRGRKPAAVSQDPQPSI